MFVWCGGLICGVQEVAIGAVKKLFHPVKIGGSFSAEGAWPNSKSASWPPPQGGVREGRLQAVGGNGAHEQGKVQVEGSQRKW